MRKMAMLAKLKPTKPRIRTGITTFEIIKNAPLMLAIMHKSDTNIRLMMRVPGRLVRIKDRPNAIGPENKAVRNISPTTAARLSMSQC